MPQSGRPMSDRVKELIEKPFFPEIIPRIK
jgi:hypothetical protein